MTPSNENSKQLLIDYYTLRKSIGWLGVLLPFALLFGNILINNLNILNQDFFVRTDCTGPYVNAGSFKTSISHYYYSTVDELFTGVLCAVALFMFCYTGHPLRKGEKGLSDKTMTSMAGMFALGVVIFPTSSDSCIPDNIRAFLSSTNTGYIHFFMAASFFITLSIMSLVNFRRSDQKESFGKKEWHSIYFVCGVGMLACLAIIFIYSMWLEGQIAWLDFIHPTFCFETIALIFFGVSWLTKGRVDYKYIPKKLRLITSQ